MARLSDLAIAQLLLRHGITGGSLITGIEIVLAESLGDPHAINHNSDEHHSTDRGLWQWNDYWHPEVSDSCAFDPDCATEKAAKYAPAYAPWSKDFARRQQFFARAFKAAGEASGGIGGGRPPCRKTLPDGSCPPGYTRVPGEDKCPCRITGLFDDRGPIEDAADAVGGAFGNVAGLVAGALSFLGKLPRYLEAGAGGFVILFGVAVIAYGGATKSASMRGAMRENAVAQAGPALKAYMTKGLARGSSKATSAPRTAGRVPARPKAPAPAREPAKPVEVPSRGRAADMTPEQRRELVRQMNREGARAA